MENQKKKKHERFNVWENMVTTQCSNGGDTFIFAHYNLYLRSSGFMRPSSLSLFPRKYRTWTTHSQGRPNMPPMNMRLDKRSLLMMMQNNYWGFLCGWQKQRLSMVVDGIWWIGWSDFDLAVWALALRVPLAFGELQTRFVWPNLQIYVAQRFLR